MPRIADFEQALPSIANLTGSPILPGNAVQILQNGDGFFPPSSPTSRGRARASISRPTSGGRGRSASASAQALADKARQGVEVRITLDAIGSHQGGRQALRHDEAGGGEDRPLPPLPPGRPRLLNNRTHRKLAIFDGRVAYVFGHGIAEEWTGHAQDKEHWRDTGVRLEGPIVNSVQAVFAAELGGRDGRGAGRGEILSPPRRRPAPVRAHMTASAPRGGVSEMELIDKLAIATRAERADHREPLFHPRPGAGRPARQRRQARACACA